MQLHVRVWLQNQSFKIRLVVQIPDLKWKRFWRKIASSFWMNFQHKILNLQVLLEIMMGFVSFWELFLG
jgi:hypothetical protein